MDLGPWPQVRLAMCCHRGRPPEQLYVGTRAQGFTFRAQVCVSTCVVWFLGGARELEPAAA